MTHESDGEEPMFRLLPQLDDEDEIVSRDWPGVERRILGRLQSEMQKMKSDAVFEDVVEHIFGPSNDDSPLPDFVARRLPPMIAAVSALMIEVWLLDSRFRCVERLAGYSLERGAMARWEGQIDQCGLLPKGESGWRPNWKLLEGDYQAVVGEDGVGVLPSAKQVVIPLSDATAVRGYVKAVFAGAEDVTLARKAEFYRLVQVLKSAISTSDFRRMKQARDDLANLGNRVADAQAFLGELVDQFLPLAMATHAASIFFVNDARDALLLARTTGLAQDAPDAPPPVYQLGVGLTGYVWKYKQTVRFPDDLESTPQALDAYSPPPTVANLSRERLPADARRQLLAVPLMREREVIGVLRLGGRTGAWRFSEWDEALAATLATQIVQIYSHLRTIGDGAAARATLLKTMELLQVEQTEDEMVLTTLLALSNRQGLGFNRAAFWAFDNDRRSLIPKMVLGAAGPEEDHVLRERISGSLEQLVKKASESPALFESGLNAGFMELKVASIDSSEDRLSRICREPFRNRVTRVNLTELRDPDTDDLHRVFRETEAAVVPLWANGTCVGCLYLDSAFDRAPIRRELEELILAHARQLASSIWAIREARKQRSTNEFYRQLPASLLAPADPFAVGRGVVAAIRSALQVERILIYCSDGTDGVVRLLGSHGFRQPLGASLLNGRLVRPLVPSMVTNRRAYFTDRAQEDQRIDAEYREALSLEGPLLAFPLELGGFITAVVVLNGESVHPGTEFTLKPLAGMLGVAIRIIAQDGRVDARDREIALLQRIQSDARLEQSEEAFCNTLAALLIEVIPAQLCSLYRPVSARSLQYPRAIEQGAFERRGHVGYPECLRNAIRVAEAGRGAGLTSHVLCGRPVNVPQVDADERWQGSEYKALTEVLGDKIRAFVGVPLLGSSGAVLGAITLTRLRTSVDDALAFQRHELEQLKRIAESIANVLELRDAQAILEEQTVRSDALSRAADRLTALVGTIRNVTDIKNLTQAVADELRRTCLADLVVVHGPIQFEHQLSPSLSGDFWHRDAVLGKRINREPRYGQRVAGEYFEDAAHAYGGHAPEDSFAKREQVKSFAHLRLSASNGEPLMCVFLNYRADRRFPPEERKMLERFASHCGLLVEFASRVVEQPARLRVVPGRS